MNKMSQILQIFKFQPNYFFPLSSLHFSENALSNGCNCRSLCSIHGHRRSYSNSSRNSTIKYHHHRQTPNQVPPSHPIPPSHADTSHKAEPTQAKAQSTTNSPRPPPAAPSTPTAPSSLPSETTG
ncbi:hypothetical protein BDZ45DRAFT_287243 [Acephala macrosclerotiorum]|nr:hypothetical protein BDZ45DRAFT_287243 [Acephala macrosclerotiorum]